MYVPRAFPPPAKCSTGRRGRPPRSVCVTSQIAELVQSLDEASVAAIGIGVPGRVDSRRGKVLSGGYVDLSGQPVAETIAGLTRRPVFIDNDGNAALFAEHAVGAARSASDGGHVHHRHRHRRRGHGRRRRVARAGIGRPTWPHRGRRRRQGLPVRPPWLRRNDEFGYRAGPPRRGSRPCRRDFRRDSCLRARRRVMRSRKACSTPGPHRCGSPSTRSLPSSTPI